MATTTRMIGAAGTGKTAAMIRLMEGCGYHPTEIGFVSMTRSARQEAAERVARQYQLAPDDLLIDGWFRTMHSVAWRILGAKSKQLILDNAEGTAWIQDAVQAPVRMESDPDSGFMYGAGDTQADKALHFWSVARNMLCTVDELVGRIPPVMGMPDPGWIRLIAHRYERAKSMDNRIDFTDLILQLAGKQIMPGSGTSGPYIEDSDQLINWPEVPVWFHDEMQDCSPAMGLAFRRLIDHPWVREVYLCGDPFQSIHSWAGADHHVFLDWPVDNEEILNRSWRCPMPIIRAGENILAGCSDYFDRGVHSEVPGGEVSDWCVLAATDINPATDTLVLARTRSGLRRVAAILNDRNIPFREIHSSRWAPAKHAYVVRFMDHLTSGGALAESEIADIIGAFKVTSSGMKRGVKGNFEPRDNGQVYTLDQLAGGDWFNESFAEFTRSGKWMNELPGADQFREGYKRHGDIVFNPPVRIGTIHAAKGMEANEVVLYMPDSKPIRYSQTSVVGRDAELRVNYVGVTRARQRVRIARR